MTTRKLTATVAVTAALLAGAIPHGAAAQQSSIPTPSEAVRLACEAAGGSDAFRKVGIVASEVASSETTIDGTTSTTTQRAYFLTPGPLPGRLEVIESRLVAGDDGQGGWAIQGGKPDARPATVQMVHRALNTALFPIFVPFSLHWEGVNVVDVLPTLVDGIPVWRLKVTFSKAFFITPQIATNWTVDFDQATWRPVRAESPYTDLGKGITADGMRYTWSQPTQIGDVTLASQVQVNGLDPAGKLRPHQRIDNVKYTVLPASEAAKLFPNPVPENMRPKQQTMQPPPGIGKPK